MTTVDDYGTMTIVMLQTVSKSQLKSQLLEYLRQVEKDRKPLIITHVGKPVAKIVPFKEDSDVILKSLQGTVLSYTDPLEPVGESDWEILR